MIRAILPFLTLSIALHADVTVRYSAETKSSLPAAMQQATSQLKSALPSEITLRIKGSKSFSQFGATSEIGDSATKQMTLLDTAGKKYATTDADQYLKSAAGAIPKMPPEAAALIASLKINSESKATGRTDTIQGIEAEEREVVVSIDGPAMPGMPPGPMMRLVMHLWMSKPSESTRVPALREWAAFNQSAMSAMSPTASLKKIFDMLPGAGDTLQAAFQEMVKPDSVMMRLHLALFMPALAAAMKSMPGTNPSGANFDPNGSLMEVNQEVVELSTAALSDSQFAIPDQYQPESLEDFLKNLMSQFTPAAK